MNTNLQLELRIGNAAMMFSNQSVTGSIFTKVHSLVGFLPINGKWFSPLDMYIQQSVAGNRLSNALPFGKNMDGGFISYFHKKVGMMTEQQLIQHKGGAVYVRGLEGGPDDLQFAFYDVVWGIVNEPSDIRLALAKAIVLAAKQKADVTTLILPWYGTKDTVVSDLQLTAHEKLLDAQAWTLGQVQGLRAAAMQLDHLVRIIILLPEKEGLIDWTDEFRTAMGAVRLADVAKITHSV